MITYLNKYFFLTAFLSLVKLITLSNAQGKASKIETTQDLFVAIKYNQRPKAIINQISQLAQNKEGQKRLHTLTDKEGNTLLHCALQQTQYNLDLINSLLQWVDVNYVNHKGETPIHIVIDKCREKYVNNLLARPCYEAFHRLAEKTDLTHENYKNILKNALPTQEEKILLGLRFKAKNIYLRKDHSKMLATLIRSEGHLDLLMKDDDLSVLFFIQLCGDSLDSAIGALALSFREEENRKSLVTSGFSRRECTLPTEISVIIAQYLKAFKFKQLFLGALSKCKKSTCFKEYLKFYSWNPYIVASFSFRWNGGEPYDKVKWLLSEDCKLFCAKNKLEYPEKDKKKANDFLDNNKMAIYLHHIESAQTESIPDFYIRVYESLQKEGGLLN